MLRYQRIANHYMCVGCAYVQRCGFQLSGASEKLHLYRYGPILVQADYCRILAMEHDAAVAVSPGRTPGTCSPVKRYSTRSLYDERGSR